MDILFYTLDQRRREPQWHKLWMQKAQLGTLTEELENGEAVVQYEEYGVQHRETVPRMFWREARERQWYEFWRRPGFHTNMYGYFGATVFFLLFIK